MSFSLSPAGGWFLWTLTSLFVLVFSYLAYRERLRPDSPFRRSARIGFALRILALIVTLFASLRPTIVLTIKREEPALLLFQVDSTRSMTLSDEAAGRSRWDLASELVQKAKEEITAIGPPLEAAYQKFDRDVYEYKPDLPSTPKGNESGIGTALNNGPERLGGKRVASIYLLSDGANNSGIPPMTAAQKLKSLRIPVNVVAFGSPNQSDSIRDIAVKDLIAGPTVFVKNRLEIKANIVSRGFQGKPLTAQLFEEGKPDPVATTVFDAPENGKPMAIRDLAYIPEEPGEKRLTLKILPVDGEITTTNNETGTYVNVLKGGLNALYIQGPAFSWEYRFLARALDASPDIRVDLAVLRRPASLSEGDLDDSLLDTGKYDVYIIDAPSSVLTPGQIQKIAKNVENGAGLLMLGGRLSFGGGAWAGTAVASLLPVEIANNAEPYEPEGGLKIVPTNAASESYITRIAADPSQSSEIWQKLPPIPGAHQFGQIKPNAAILLETEDQKPLLVSQELGRGRTLAFAGETWVWPRGSILSDDDQNTEIAHRRFWRQSILWLAHKENQDESPIVLTLNQRLMTINSPLDFSVEAKNSKGDAIEGVSFETSVELIAPSNLTEKDLELTIEEEPLRAKQSVDVFVQGSEATGRYLTKGVPGEYRMTVTGRVNGEVIGVDSSRFLVWQDDREMEPPTADPDLLSAIANSTGGKVLKPEELLKELKAIDLRQFSEFESQEERRLWDNWPLLLLFISLITTEWIVRRKSGMV
ncbi:MAG: hypothetical protein RJA81_1223 [Planctomycetota bacterium]